MSGFRIFTDSSCDLPQALADSYGLTVLPLTITLEGATYHNLLDGSKLGFHALYEKLRGGVSASTSAVNPAAFRDAMEQCLLAGDDILYVGFSSGLSTTYQSGCIAADELRESYPDRRIICIDSLCASLGQGLLLHLAVEKQRAGHSLDEVAAFVEQTKLHICHWFTVDDLMFLKRGGRIPATTALLGTALQIKPVMHMDDNGKLVSVSKARGRKASLAALVQKMNDTGIDIHEQTVFISHGDCLADAEYTASLIRERVGVKDVIINYVGPVIGSHAGPGTLSVFFVGTER